MECICVWSNGEMAVTDGGGTLSVTLCTSYPTWTALESNPTRSRGEMRGIA